MNHCIGGAQFVHAIIAHYKGSHVGNTFDSRRDYNAECKLFQAKAKAHAEVYYSSVDAPERMKRHLDLITATMKKTGKLAGPKGRPNDESFLRYLFMMNVYWLEQKGFLVADESNGMQFISLFDNIIPDVDIVVNSNVGLIEPEGSQFQDND